MAAATVDPDREASAAARCGVRGGKGGREAAGGVYLARLAHLCAALEREVVPAGADVVAHLDRCLDGGVVLRHACAHILLAAWLRGCRSEAVDCTAGGRLFSFFFREEKREQRRGGKPRSKEEEPKSHKKPARLPLRLLAKRSMMRGQRGSRSAPTLPELRRDRDRRRAVLASIPLLTTCSRLTFEDEIRRYARSQATGTPCSS